MNRAEFDRWLFHHAEGGFSQAAARREIGELIGANPDTLRG